MNFKSGQTGRAHRIVGKTDAHLYYGVSQARHSGKLLDLDYLYRTMTYEGDAPFDFARLLPQSHGVRIYRYLLRDRSGRILIGIRIPEPAAGHREGQLLPCRASAPRWPWTASTIWTGASEIPCRCSGP